MKLAPHDSQFKEETAQTLKECDQRRAAGILDQYEEEGCDPQYIDNDDDDDHDDDSFNPPLNFPGNYYSRILISMKGTDNHAEHATTTDVVMVPSADSDTVLKIIRRETNCT